MKLVHLLLNVLIVNGMTKLNNIFMFDLHRGTDTYSPQYQTRMNNTLVWMRSLQPRVSLQHIARQTVLRVMSYRSLHDAATLGLPVHLKQYVLMED